MSYTIDSREGISYPAAFLILTGLLLVSFVVGSFAGAAVWAAMTGKDILTMQTEMFDPKYVNVIRVVQLVSTFFIFFVPAIITASILNRKPFRFLGYNDWFDAKTAGITLLVMLVSLPLVGALTELNKMIPVPASMETLFRQMEDAYEKQVKIMSKMDGIGDYFLSIIVMALGPAIFEETFFRGALQNILHKWSGRKWMPLIITSLVFSAIHFSYYGFIPRMALGIILGLLYLRSGSLWMSILAHFINNAFVVTVIFYLTSQGRSIEDAMEETDPLWVGAIALVAIVCLFMYYKKFSEDVKKRKMPVEDRALGEQWLA